MIWKILIIFKCNDGTYFYTPDRVPIDAKEIARQNKTIAKETSHSRPREILQGMENVLVKLPRNTIKRIINLQQNRMRPTIPYHLFKLKFSIITTLQHNMYHIMMKHFL